MGGVEAVEGVAVVVVVVAAMVVAAMITGGTNVLVAYKDRLGRFAGPVVAAGGAALTGGSAYLAWISRPRRRPR